jgi:hypothetical protein
MYDLRFNAADLYAAASPLESNFHHVLYQQDGHHRISVARTMGQTAIEAEVTVWDVRGPLPWERRLSPRPAVQIA